MSPVALSSSDFSNLFKMSHNLGETMIPLFWVARSFTKPEEVVLLMMEEVRSRFSKWFCDACCMADDFPLQKLKNIQLGME